MTFSITARCPATGMLGIAIASSSPAVAARCAHVRAGVGAVSTQNVTDPRLGPRALDLMMGGMTPQAVLKRFEADERHLEYRQLALVDAQGQVAFWSGSKSLGIHGAQAGAGVVAVGNLLKNEEVPSAMVAAYLAERSPFASRLLVAMRAAMDAGGEEGQVRSAGLLVADREAWPLVDLRVDWSEQDPIAALERLWMLWEPQMHAYVQRALDPASAPSFGIAGDPGR